MVNVLIFSSGFNPIHMFFKLMDYLLGTLKKENLRDSSKLKIIKEGMSQRLSSSWDQTLTKSPIMVLRTP